jgi:hypothetical protein
MVVTTWAGFFRLADGTFEPLGRIEADNGTKVMATAVNRMLERLVLTSAEDETGPPQSAPSSRSRAK